MNGEEKYITEGEIAEEVEIEHLPARGDSFDIGRKGGDIIQPGTGALSDILSNPNQLVKSLNLTPQQARNVKSIIAAGGAGISHQLLSNIVGSELAGAVGGFLGGYLSRKMLGR